MDKSYIFMQKVFCEKCTMLFRYEKNIVLKISTKYTIKWLAEFDLIDSYLFQKENNMLVKPPILICRDI